MMVFLARLQGSLPLPSSGFAFRARSFTSHLREVTNSSHLVKVDTEVFAWFSDPGRARIYVIERRSDYLPVLPYWWST